MLNDLLNAYIEFWIKATEFKGFTSRSDWWLVQLANLIISLLTKQIYSKNFKNFPYQSLKNHKKLK